jgi:hypothetical protein
MKKHELPAEGFADREARVAFWSKAISAQKKSKLTQIEFCKRNGLPLETFKSRLKKSRQGERANFVELKMLPVTDQIQQHDADNIEIQLLTGEKIKLSGRHLPALLETALIVLSRQKC